MKNYLKFPLPTTASWFRLPERVKALEEAPAPIPFSPLDYDLEDFTNAAIDPFVKVSEVASYKVYSAKVFMSDGSTTVYQNTLGATPTWTTSSGQISTGVIGSLIGQNNVYVQVSSSAPSGSPKIVSGEFAPTPWSVTIKQIDDAGVADSTQAVYVEIRVYN